MTTTNTPQQRAFTSAEVQDLIDYYNTLWRQAEGVCLERDQKIKAAICAQQDAKQQVVEYEPIETAPDTKDILMLWVDGEWWFGRREFDNWKVFGYPKDRGRPAPQFWRPQPPTPPLLTKNKE